MSIGKSHQLCLPAQHLFFMKSEKCNIIFTWATMLTKGFAQCIQKKPLKWHTASNLTTQLIISYRSAAWAQSLQDSV